MRRRGAGFVRCFALSAQLAVLLLLAGCAIPQVPSRTIYEDPVNYVRLEEEPNYLPEWPPSHHSHPAVLEPEILRQLLQGLVIQEHRIWLQRWLMGEAPYQAAFQDREIALLSVQLAEALAQAGANERVTFYLSEPQASTKRLVTSGGLYMKGTELHLILGNWQIVYGIPTYGMIYDRRYPMRPTAAKGFDLFFQPHEAMRRTENSWIDSVLANGADEVVVDLKKLPPPSEVSSATSGSQPEN
ncbi:MAG: hypothetical protein IT389_12610 [Nitrospira sp.]|nr:hypothetical protein [Nitrospira sp.]